MHGDGKNLFGKNCSFFSCNEKFWNNNNSFGFALKQEKML